MENIADAIFDKEALIHQHETAANQARLAANFFTSYMSIADPVSRPGAPSVPLQGLRSIRLRQLNVGRSHRGRVLFGTLCVDPFKRVGVMTVLQDDQGLAIRVAVYNVPASESTPAALDAKYPKGAKVAIREPYIKQAADGGLAIRIDDPANLVRVTGEASLDKEPPIDVLDLEEERRKGNECFRKQDWRGALTHYTNCIQAPNNGEPRTGETDAVARLFQQSGDGRALHGLKDYAQAYQVLQAALELSPGQADIDAALRQSRASCARNRLGEYDISGFLLGIQPPGKVGDFIGDVEIKKTRDGRGCGLYATKKISTGELFLVSNAVAIDDHGIRPFKYDERHKIQASSPQEDLVAAVIGAAKTSQKLLQQLYVLDEGSEHVRASTPAMDLFDANSQETTGMQLLQIDEQRIRDIVSRNSLGGEAEMSASSLGFSGLWMVPSFINHSCIPNATRLNVERAMFLHATKPIEKGEEITISYFVALLPLPQREAMCEAWGFKCNCKRCALEKPLKPAFKSLNEQFEALHNIALEETNSARSSGEEFPTELPKSAEFARVYEKMEKKKSKYRRMKLEETHWIRASYVTAYWAGTQSDEFFRKTLEDPIPTGDKILEAVVNTIPGDL
ncbi:hypothetical protein SUGI_0493330 [Cryptomeria japonica]|nr:hypothetical protein SUGI_0493330 [Cryptomeria japonica]